MLDKTSTRSRWLGLEPEGCDWTQGNVVAMTAEWIDGLLGWPGGLVVQCNLAQYSTQEGNKVDQEACKLSRGMETWHLSRIRYHGSRGEGF